MLSLTAPNKFSGIVNSGYNRLESYSFTGLDHAPNIYAEPSIYLADALLPLFYNGINVSYKVGVQHYTRNNDKSLDALNEAYRETAISEAISYAYNSTEPNTLKCLVVYTTDVDRSIEALKDTAKDCLVSVPDAVKALYNKCADQITARNDLMDDFNVQVKAYLFKGKHGLVLFTNYTDSNQLSLGYLSIGLIPVLFKDWAPKFNEDEIAYFKSLVNRSQIKRISNVAVIEAFGNIFTGSNKYEELKKTLMIEPLVDSYIRMRVSAVEQQVVSCANSLRNVSVQYDRVYADYLQACKILSSSNNDRDSVREELLTALALEGIVDVRPSGGSSLKIKFLTYLEYYDTELLELTLNNRNPHSLINRILRRVFIDGKYKVKVFNYFFYDLDPEASFRKPGRIDIDELTQYNALFNPHTYYFNCLGDYEPNLIRAYRNRDLVLFNNLALASTKSINFADTAVLNRLISDLGFALDGDNALANIAYLEDVETHECITLNQLANILREEVTETNEEELDIPTTD